MRAPAKYVAKQGEGGGDALIWKKRWVHLIGVCAFNRRNMVNRISKNTVCIKNRNLNECQTKK